MERLSIFDIFKVGVGPSSSHTLGPWRAAQAFTRCLGDKRPESIRVQLFGSLSKTGRGHATDFAVILGLMDQDPVTCDTSQISALIENVRHSKQITINGGPMVFDPGSDIVFEPESYPAHPNTLRFEATFRDNPPVQGTWFSTGGGFIVREGHLGAEAEQIDLPYPIDSGADLILHTSSTGLPIDGVVWQNELALRPADEIKSRILDLYGIMLRSVYRGCNTQGTLPGGLNVRRRAADLYKRLLPSAKYTGPISWVANITATGRDFGNINQWVSCFAMAVNEENAALGRIVTAPTNGAAGVIPAVLLYHNCFCDSLGDSDIIKFMLTAGEIGCIFKKRATISAAMGGCQAEIGVSSAMAAAGLTAIQGGTPRQVLMAAEIAMEHHLGMTCDPVAGLVQIPCIERNTMGAIKAITATNLALVGDPSHAIIDFDTVVRTMWDTAVDMHHKYKETSDGGLAISLPVVIPEC